MDRQPSWNGLRRRAVIDQQLWFLGRDIAGASGNALLAYGFEKRRSRDRNGSTSYLLPLVQPASEQLFGSSGVLICWGFALYAGAAPAEAPGASLGGRLVHHPTHDWAGVTIERFGDTPGLLRTPVAPTLHQVSELPRATSPRTEADRTLATRALRMIALTLSAYERWAINTLGIAHRRAALRDAPRHKRHRFSHVLELSTVWEQLAGDEHATAPDVIAARADVVVV